MHLSIVSGAAALVSCYLVGLKAQVRALHSLNNSGVPIIYRTVHIRIVTEVQQT